MSTTHTELNNYTIPSETLDAHLATTRVLYSDLQRNPRETLTSILTLLQGTNNCRDRGPECIEAIGINKAETIPAFCIDVHAGKNADWGGCHFAFYIPSKSWGHLPGHLIFRNLDGLGAGEEHFTASRADQWENIRQHEKIHILQVLSDQHARLFTDAELDPCNGRVALVPMIAAQGKYSKEAALKMARLYLLQCLQNELEAYTVTDYPFYVGYLDREDRDAGGIDVLRMTLTMTLVRQPVSIVKGAFLDTYGLSWGELLSTIEDELSQLVEGSFVEAPIHWGGKRLTLLDCIKKSIAEA